MFGLGGPCLYFSCRASNLFPHALPISHPLSGPPHLATLAVWPMPCPHRNGKRASSPHSASRRASSVLVPTSLRESTPPQSKVWNPPRRSSALSSGRNPRMACTGWLGRPHTAPPSSPQRSGRPLQRSWLFGSWDLSRHEPQAGAKLVTTRE